MNPLIAEARRLKAESERAPFTNFQFEQVGRRMIAGGFLAEMSDALEAAEAQVAILQTHLAMLGASSDKCEFPADLLAAVRHAKNNISNTMGVTCEKCNAALAIFKRYGLLPAAPVEDAP